MQSYIEPGQDYAMQKLQHFFKKGCVPEKPQSCVAGAAESPTPAGDTWLGTLHMPVAAPAKGISWVAIYQAFAQLGCCFLDA